MFTVSNFNVFKYIQSFRNFWFDIWHLELTITIVQDLFCGVVIVGQRVAGITILQVQESTFITMKIFNFKPD